MIDRIKAEPVVFAGLLTALVTALMGLAVGFEWVTWDSTQQGLILAVWAAFIAILTFLIRGKVTPV
jgi:hypothetical protein